MHSKVKFKLLAERCISIVLIVCFVTTSIAWAAPAASTPNPFQRLSKISIPEEYGRIDELYFPDHATSESPLIVYLQDAHANLGAQENISKIAASLEKQLKIQAILKEGGNGEADLTQLRNFSDKSIKNSVTQFWMKEGVLSGIEREAITANKSYRFFGIENEELYKKASGHFVEVQKTSASVLSQINVLSARNKAKQKEIFNPDLLKFEDLAQRFESKHDLVALVDLIANEARNRHINRWKYLEVEKFIDLILVEMNGGQSERFFEIQRTLDSKKLFSEIDLLKTEVKESLFQNKKERALDREVGILSVLKAVLSLEATPQDFSFFEQNKALVKKYLKIQRLDSKPLESSEQFYELAKKRDRVLFSNIKDILDKKEIKRAFLVAGGFHAQSMTEQFKANGIAYIVISPQISDENNFQSYYARIAGQRATLDYFKSKSPQLISSAHAGPVAVLIRSEVDAIAGSFRWSLKPIQPRHLSSPKSFVGDLDSRLRHSGMTMLMAKNTVFIFFISSPVLISSMFATQRFRRAETRTGKEDSAELGKLQEAIEVVFSEAQNILSELTRLSQEQGELKMVFRRGNNPQQTFLEFMGDFNRAAFALHALSTKQGTPQSVTEEIRGELARLNFPEYEEPLQDLISKLPEESEEELALAVHNFYAAYSKISPRAETRTISNLKSRPDPVNPVSGNTYWYDDQDRLVEIRDQFGKVREHNEWQTTDPDWGMVDQRVTLANLKGYGDLQIIIRKNRLADGLEYHLSRVRIGGKKIGNFDFRILDNGDYYLQNFYPIGTDSSASYSEWKNKWVAKTILNWLVNQAALQGRTVKTQDYHGTQNLALVRLFEELFADEVWLWNKNAWGDLKFNREIQLPNGNIAKLSDGKTPAGEIPYAGDARGIVVRGTPKPLSVNFNDADNTIEIYQKNQLIQTIPNESQFQKRAETRIDITRTKDQSIEIGDFVRLDVIEVKNNFVRLTITAPLPVSIVAGRIESAVEVGKGRQTTVMLHRGEIVSIGDNVKVEPIGFRSSNKVTLVVQAPRWIAVRRAETRSTTAILVASVIVAAGVGFGFHVRNIYRRILLPDYLERKALARELIKEFKDRARDKKIPAPKIRDFYRKALADYRRLTARKAQQDLGFSILRAFNFSANAKDTLAYQRERDSSLRQKLERDFKLKMVKAQDKALRARKASLEIRADAWSYDFPAPRAVTKHLEQKKEKKKAAKTEPVASASKKQPAAPEKQPKRDLKAATEELWAAYMNEDGALFARAQHYQGLAVRTPTEKMSTNLRKQFATEINKFVQALSSKHELSNDQLKQLSDDGRELVNDLAATMTALQTAERSRRKEERKLEQLQAEEDQRKNEEEKATQKVAQEAGNEIYRKIEHLRQVVSSKLPYFRQKPEMVRNPDLIEEDKTISKLILGIAEAIDAAPIPEEEKQGWSTYAIGALNSAKRRLRQRAETRAFFLDVDFLANGTANQIGLRYRDALLTNAPDSAVLLVLRNPDPLSKYDYTVRHQKWVVYDVFVRPAQELKTLDDIKLPQFYQASVTLNFDADGKLSWWEPVYVEPAQAQNLPWLRKFLDDWLKARAGEPFLRTSPTDWPEHFTTLSIDPKQGATRRAETRKTIEDWHRQFEQLDKAAEASGQQFVQIALSVREASGRVVTEQVRISFGDVENSKDDLSVYLAKLIANRGLIAGATEVAIDLNRTDALNPAELIQSVEQKFRGLGKSDDFASFGKGVRFLQGKLAPQATSPVEEQTAPVDYKKGSAIGFDIGGTNIKYGIRRNGVDTLRFQSVSALKQNGVSIGAFISETIKALSKDYSIDFSKTPIYVTVPGPVTPEGDIVVITNLDNEIPGTADSLRQLRAEFPNVKFQNDANVAGFFQMVNADLSGDVIFNTLGTGLGAAVMIDGKLIAGPQEAHLQLYSNEDAFYHDGFQLTGDLESYANRDFVIRRARELANLPAGDELTPKIVADWLDLDAESNLRKIAETVYGEFGATLAAFYKETSRVMGRNEWTVVLVGNIAQGKTVKAILEGVSHSLSGTVTEVSKDGKNFTKIEGAGLELRFLTDIEEPGFSGALGSIFLGLQEQQLTFTRAETRLPDLKFNNSTELKQALERAGFLNGRHHFEISDLFEYQEGVHRKVSFKLSFPNLFFQFDPTANQATIILAYNNVASSDPLERAVTQIAIERQGVKGSAFSKDVIPDASFNQDVFTGLMQMLYQRGFDKMDLSLVNSNAAPFFRKVFSSLGGIEGRDFSFYIEPEPIHFVHGTEQFSIYGRVHTNFSQLPKLVSAAPRAETRSNIAFIGDETKRAEEIVLPRKRAETRTDSFTEVGIRPGLTIDDVANQYLNDPDIEHFEIARTRYTLDLARQTFGNNPLTPANTPDHEWTSLRIFYKRAETRTIENVDELRSKLKTIRTDKSKKDQLRELGTNILRERGLEKLEQIKTSIEPLDINDDVKSEIKRILSVDDEKQLNRQRREEIAAILLFLIENFNISVEGFSLPSPAVEGKVLFVLGFHQSKKDADKMFEALEPHLPPLLPNLPPDEASELVFHLERIEPGMIPKMLLLPGISSADDEQGLTRSFAGFRDKVIKGLERDARALRRGEFPDDSAYAKSGAFSMGLYRGIKRLKDRGYRVRLFFEDPAPKTWWLWDRSEMLFQEAANEMLQGNESSLKTVLERADRMRYKSDEIRDLQEEGPRINSSRLEFPSSTHVVFRGLKHSNIETAVKIPADLKQIIPTVSDLDRYEPAISLLHRLRREGGITGPEEEKMRLQEILISLLGTTLMKANKDFVSFLPALKAAVGQLDTEDILRVSLSFQQPPNPPLAQRMYEIFYRLKANFPQAFPEGSDLVRNMEESITTLHDGAYTPLSTAIPPRRAETRSANELTNKSFEELKKDYKKVNSWSEFFGGAVAWVEHYNKAALVVGGAVTFLAASLWSVFLSLAWPQQNHAILVHQTVELLKMSLFWWSVYGSGYFIFSRYGPVGYLHQRALNHEANIRSEIYRRWDEAYDALSQGTDSIDLIELNASQEELLDIDTMNFQRSWEEERQAEENLGSDWIKTREPLWKRVFGTIFSSPLTVQKQASGQFRMKRWRARKDLLDLMISAGTTAETLGDRRSLVRVLVHAMGPDVVDQIQEYRESDQLSRAETRSTDDMNFEDKIKEIRRLVKEHLRQTSIREERLVLLLLQRVGERVYKQWDLERDTYLQTLFEHYFDFASALLSSNDPKTIYLIMHSRKMDFLKAHLENLVDDIPLFETNSRIYTVSFERSSAELDKVFFYPIAGTNGAIESRKPLTPKMKAKIDKASHFIEAQGGAELMRYLKAARLRWTTLMLEDWITLFPILISEAQWQAARHREVTYGHDTDMDELNAAAGRRLTALQSAGKTIQFVLKTPFRREDKRAFWAEWIEKELQKAEKSLRYLENREVFDLLSYDGKSWVREMKAVWKENRTNFDKLMAGRAETRTASGEQFDGLVRLMIRSNVTAILQSVDISRIRQLQAKLEELARLFLSASQAENLTQLLGKVLMQGTSKSNGNVQRLNEALLTLDVRRDVASVEEMKKIADLYVRSGMNHSIAVYPLYGRPYYFPILSSDIPKGIARIEEKLSQEFNSQLTGASHFEWEVTEKEFSIRVAPPWKENIGSEKGFEEFPESVQGKLKVAKTFIERLLIISEFLGWSHPDIASVAGLPRNSSYAWSGDQMKADPRPSTMIALSQVLRVNPYFMIYGKTSFQVLREARTPSERVRLIMKTKGLTSHSLAPLLGISHQNIRSIFTRAKWNRETIFAFAQALDVSPAFLETGWRPTTDLFLHVNGATGYLRGREVNSLQMKMRAAKLHEGLIAAWKAENLPVSEWAPRILPEDRLQYPGLAGRMLTANPGTLERMVLYGLISQQDAQMLRAKTVFDKDQAEVNKAVVGLAKSLALAHKELEEFLTDYPALRPPRGYTNNKVMRLNNTWDFIARGLNRARILALIEQPIGMHAFKKALAPSADPERVIFEKENEVDKLIDQHSRVLSRFDPRYARTYIRQHIWHVRGLGTDEELETEMKVLSDLIEMGETNWFLLPTHGHGEIGATAYPSTESLLNPPAAKRVLEHIQRRDALLRQSISGRDSVASRLRNFAQPWKAMKHDLNGNQEPRGFSEALDLTHRVFAGLESQHESFSTLSASRAKAVLTHIADATDAAKTEWPDLNQAKPDKVVRFLTRAVLKKRAETRNADEQVAFYQTNYHGNLANLNEYPDGASILRGFELVDGQYKPRRFDPGAYILVHQIDSHSTLMEEAHAAFHEYLRGLEDIFGADKDKIKTWEVGDTNAHLGVMVFQEHQELLDNPIQFLSPEEVEKIKSAVQKRIGAEAPISLTRMGYGITANGGFVVFLIDSSGRFMPLKQALADEANLLTGNKISGRPKLGHISIGRILELPYSAETEIRARQIQQVNQLVQKTAQKFEAQWRQNLQDQSRALVYTINNASLIHERQWLTMSGERFDFSFRDQSQTGPQKPFNENELLEEIAQFVSTHQNPVVKITPGSPYVLRDYRTLHGFDMTTQGRMLASIALHEVRGRNLGYQSVKVSKRQSGEQNIIEIEFFLEPVATAKAETRPRKTDAEQIAELVQLLGDKKYHESAAVGLVVRARESSQAFKVIQNAVIQVSKSQNKTLQSGANWVLEQLKTESSRAETRRPIEPIHIVGYEHNTAEDFESIVPTLNQIISSAVQKNQRVLVIHEGLWAPANVELYTAGSQWEFINRVRRTWQRNQLENYFNEHVRKMKQLIGRMIRRDQSILQEKHGATLIAFLKWYFATDSKVSLDFEEISIEPWLDFVASEAALSDANVALRRGIRNPQRRQFYIQSIRRYAEAFSKHMAKRDKKIASQAVSPAMNQKNVILVLGSNHQITPILKKQGYQATGQKNLSAETLELSDIGAWLAAGNKLSDAQMEIIALRDVIGGDLRNIVPAAHKQNSNRLYGFSYRVARRWSRDEIVDYNDQHKWTSQREASDFLRQWLVEHGTDEEREFFGISIPEQTQPAPPEPIKLSLTQVIDMLPKSGRNLASQVYGQVKTQEFTDMGAAESAVRASYDQISKARAETRKAQAKIKTQKGHAIDALGFLSGKKPKERLHPAVFEAIDQKQANKTSMKVNETDMQTIWDRISAAESKGQELSVSAPLRGAVFGSGQDVLPTQRLLTREEPSIELSAYPSLIAFAHENRIKATLGLARDSEGKHLPNSIQYINNRLRINRITQVPMKLTAVDFRTPEGQADAVAYLLGNVFGLRGIRIEIEEDGIAVTAGGGFENSNIYDLLIGLVGQVLSKYIKRDISTPELISLLIRAASNEFNDMTGGQGILSAYLGARRFYFFGGILGPDGQPLSPSAIFAEPIDPALSGWLNKGSLVLQPGQKYVNGVAEERNDYTSRMMIDVTSILHPGAKGRARRMVKLTSMMDQALKSRNMVKLKKAINEYTNIRIWFQVEWLKLAQEPGQPFYETRKLDPFLNNLEPFNLEHPRMPQKQDAPYLGGHARILRVAKRMGLAVMPMGKGSFGSNWMLFGDPAAIERFKTQGGYDLLTDDEANEKTVNEETARGEQEIKGWMPPRILGPESPLIEFSEAFQEAFNFNQNELLVLPEIDFSPEQLIPGLQFPQRNMADLVQLTQEQEQSVEAAMQILQENFKEAGLEVDQLNRDYLRQMLRQRLTSLHYQVAGRPIKLSFEPGGTFHLLAEGSNAFISSEYNQVSIETILNQASYLKTASRTRVRYMNALGGSGVRTGRREMLARRRKIAVKDVKVSTKGIDLGIDVTIEVEGRGKQKIFLSILEIQMRQLISMAQNKNFSAIDIQSLISPKSKASLSDLLQSPFYESLLEPTPEPTRTYSQAMTDSGMTILNPLVQADLPGREIQTDLIAANRDLPHSAGGTGYWLFKLVHEILATPAPGESEVWMFIGGDNAAAPIPELVGYVVDQGIPILQVNTTNTLFDRDAGRTGWQEFDGKVVPDIIEPREIAKSATSALIYQAGQPGGLGFAGHQTQNTNMYYINRGLLRSILERLVSAVGKENADILDDIITPDFIQNLYEEGVEPIDGAFSSSVHRLNRYLVHDFKTDARLNTAERMAVEGILPAFGLEQLLHFVNLPTDLRTPFYFPIKNTTSAYMLGTDRLRYDKVTKRFVDPEPGLPLVAFSLASPDPKFYEDEFRLYSVFGRASVKNAFSITANGSFILTDRHVSDVTVAYSRDKGVFDDLKIPMREDEEAKNDVTFIGRVEMFDYRRGSVGLVSPNQRAKLFAPLNLRSPQMREQIAALKNPGIYFDENDTLVLKDVRIESRIDQDSFNRYFIKLLAMNLPPVATAKSETRHNGPVDLYENLLEGVGDQAPAWLRHTPNWERMNIIGRIILNKIHADSRPIVLDDQLKGYLIKKMIDHGIGDDVNIQALMDHMVNIGFLRKTDEGYLLAVEEQAFAIKFNAIRFIKREFEIHLQKLKEKAPGAKIHLINFIRSYAAASERWKRYPVESRYPILKAINLMFREDRQQLLKFLKTEKASFKSRPPDSPIMPLVDSIILMLNLDSPEKWLEENAPAMVNRTVFNITPEAINAAGGLGRVEQSHGVAFKILQDNAGQFAFIEPYYPFRIIKVKEIIREGETEREIERDVMVKDVDYSKLPLPVEDLDLSKPLFTYTTRVRKGRERKDVTVEVFKGRVKVEKEGKTLWIDVYLIKDRPAEEGGEEYYTKALYRYGHEYGSATWKEFTEFFSKASLKLVKRLKKQEREAKEKNGEYKDPFFWLQDGQTGPFGVFKRMSDELDRLSPEERERIMQEDPDWREHMDLITDTATEDSLISVEGNATTHTFNNRGEYDHEEGEDFMRGMRIPQKYRQYFHRGGSHYDSTSGMMRTLRGNGVATMHVESKVSQVDPKNNSKAITNGDNLFASSKYFRDIFMHESFQTLFPDADPENPTPEQLVEEKFRSKWLLKQDQDLLALDPEFEHLNPEAAVIGVYGRLVREKTGLSRAFVRKNIEEILKRANVIIFGNVQGSDESKGMFRYLKELQAELNKRPGNKGRLIVATGWGQIEQRKVLAATDMQVNDSDPDTEAAGFSETNVAANGGIEITLPAHEGIYQQQGEIIDWSEPGVGNTLIAAAETPEAYLRVFNKALDEYGYDSEHGLNREKRLNFARYQATSKRLSLILKAELTSAEYQRLFNEIVQMAEHPIDTLINYVSADQSIGLSFKSEWDRKALVQALNELNSAVPFRVYPHDQNESADVFVVPGISASDQINIVAVEHGTRYGPYKAAFKIRDEEVNGVRPLQKIAELFGLGGLDQTTDKFLIVDAVTGQLYGSYTGKELIEDGLNIAIPNDTNVQVLTIKRVSAESTAYPDIEANKSTVFSSPLAPPEVKQAILSLIPEGLLKHLGITEQNLVLFTPSEGFDRKAQVLGDQGAYLIINKGSGHLSLSLTKTFEGAFDEVRQRNAALAHTTPVFIDLNVDGNTLRIGYGNIQSFPEMNVSPYRDFNRPMFHYWYVNQLKPWAKKMGFDYLQIQQFELDDQQLTALGFVKIQERIGNQAAIWQARVNHEAARAETRLTSSAAIAKTTQKSRMIVSFESLTHDAELRSELRRVMKANANNEQLEIAILAPEYTFELQAEDMIMSLFRENIFVIYKPVQLYTQRRLGLAYHGSAAQAFNRLIAMKRKDIDAQGFSSRVIAIADREVLSTLSRRDLPKLIANAGAPEAALLLFQLDGSINWLSVAGPSGIMDPTRSFISFLHQSMLRQLKLAVAA